MGQSSTTFFESVDKNVNSHSGPVVLPQYGREEGVPMRDE